MKRMVPMMFVLGFFLFAQSAQADWAPTKRLTWNSGDSPFPSMAVDSSGNVHVVWEDGTARDLRDLLQAEHGCGSHLVN